MLGKVLLAMLNFALCGVNVGFLIYGLRENFSPIILGGSAGAAAFAFGAGILILLA
jgi:hypothetical protein